MPLEVRAVLIVMGLFAALLILKPFLHLR